MEREPIESNKVYVLEDEEYNNSPNTYKNQAFESLNVLDEVS